MWSMYQQTFKIIAAELQDEFAIQKYQYFVHGPIYEHMDRQKGRFQYTPEIIRFVGV